MRSVKQNDVSVFGNVVRECAPACLPSKWKTSKTSEMEYFTISVAHQSRDVLVVVIVVQFIRARTLCKYGVFLSDSKFLDLLIHNFVYVSAWKCRVKVLLY